MTLHSNIFKPDGGHVEHWQEYHCAHCDTKVTGAIIAWYPASGNNQRHVRWLFCPNCYQGSTWIHGKLHPGTLFGPKLQGLPPIVEEIYEEARRCMSVNAYTAAELLCRKLLMNVSVEKGADEGKTFAYYLGQLEAQGYITPSIKGWVDLIRSHGNKATHEIDQPSEDRAKNTLTFTATLLRIIYEMDYLSQQYLPHNEI